jgi:hypothetical protein
MVMIIPMLEEGRMEVIITHDSASINKTEDDCHTSDSDSPETKDKEIWSILNLESHTLSNTGAKASCSQPDAEKKARHMLVERRRRDKTRAFIEQLQTVLPNIEYNRPNPNVNFVLEKTLQYLQSIGFEPCITDMHGAGASVQDKRENMELAKLAVHVARNVFPMPIDDVSSRRYMFSFDNAPLGIVISRIDGVFLKANQFFRNIFRFPQGSQLMVTMFSLTASKDLAMTMKVATTRLFLPRTVHRGCRPIDILSRGHD